ncbi:sodium channel protein Nach-like [Atheta coriaria]|uniref:sodium channel protein Nach-like n=1 Tax=Dalotia coriaria TaxID=877792 RepID=UPI0031F3E8DE
MSFWSVIKYYLKHSNLHGLHHIADEKTSIFYRFAWLFIVLLSTLGMMRIFKSSYDSYLQHSISFATETTYLNWNTTFPAISVCEIAGTEVFWTADPSENYSPMQQFLSDIIFFTGSCYSCSTNCVECKEMNYKSLVRQYRKKCTSLIGKCKWNDVEFDCCDHFLPLNTEYGWCFAINSIHTIRQKGMKQQQMFSNRFTGPGQLVIENIDDIRLYIHAPEDVPFINSDTDLRKEVVLGERYQLDFKVIEIANDENVRSVNVEKRGCRFPDEIYPELKVHKFYSYSTCIVQCHADAHINLCNCTHHLMPVVGDANYCNIEGLLCLTEYFETVNRLHAKGFDKPGLVCDCVPSCVEPEYNIVSENKGVKSSNGEISIRLQALPTLRFKRNVVRTTLDLVVSIGGTAGLFVGASLLSIIETVYLLILRRNYN